MYQITPEERRELINILDNNTAITIGVARRIVNFLENLKPIKEKKDEPETKRG